MNRDLQSRTAITHLQAGRLPATDHETLTPDQRRTERFGLEIRTHQGLPLALIHPPRPVLERMVILIR
jgi:coproporphyrinogen III oxidase-like Fe-S oxidoreductase